MMEKTLGVLAGVGHLPVDVVRGAKQAGYRTVAIALVPETHEDLPKEADVFYAIKYRQSWENLQHPQK